MPQWLPGQQVSRRAGTSDLEVYDLQHLTAILAQRRAQTVVAKAERVNG